jgi:hypothetical protein
MVPYHTIPTRWQKLEGLGLSRSRLKLLGPVLRCTLHSQNENKLFDYNDYQSQTMPYLLCIALQGNLLFMISKK